MTTPLIEAHRVIRQAFLFALEPICDVDDDGLHKVYWKKATQDVAAPFLIVQPQGDGEEVATIGDSGWAGDVVVKAYGPDEASAEDLLIAAEAVINAGIPAPGGYSMGVRWVKPVDLATSEGLNGCGQRYAVEIHRNS